MNNRLRTRRRKSAAADLIELPWQISAVLAVAGFVAMRWVLPSFIPDTPMLAGLRMLCEPLSWIALMTGCVLALIAAMRSLTVKKDDAGRAQLSSSRPVVRVRAGDIEAARRPASAGVHSTQSALPGAWSLEALRTLEWKRFELLCAKYYQAVGFRTETLDAGPDGGIDIKLFKDNSSMPLAVVQCKAWNTRQVGVKEIRELLGSMVHVKVARGIFITTGSYSADALAFGAANPIQLLDGAALDQRIRALAPGQQEALLRFAFDGDYQTPTCPSCGVRMLARDSKRGQFWGCMHYPRCKSTIPMRSRFA